MQFELFAEQAPEIVNEWRCVPGFPAYEMNPKAVFRNKITGRTFRGHFCWTGYRHITLSKNGKAYSLLIHRLVAEAFVSKPSELHSFVNHKDKDRANNNAENLEWVTRSQNAAHSKRGPRRFKRDG